MDQSRFIAKHVVNLPKSGIRDFFDIVAKMKDAISLGVGESVDNPLFNYGEFAAIKCQLPVLIPSNSMELKNQSSGRLVFNPVEFDGIGSNDRSQSQLLMP
jgi:hypothetical protein